MFMICASCYLTAGVLNYLIWSSQQPCNYYCYHYFNDEKNWGTQRLNNASKVTYPGFETRLSYISTSILTLPKYVHIHRYICNNPENIYINNSFFLGVRLQVEKKNVTFTLNFHTYCIFDIQAHIDVITIFCRL